MTLPRDNQRTRCYRWEEACTKGAHMSGVFKSAPECAAWLAPIWRSERGRYGRANAQMPEVASSSWGQRSALAHGTHKITLPKWARNPWVILHEAAHCLTPKDEAHGPRFVGVLIGLASRHLGYDAAELMALADKMGLRYKTTSIGSVPVRGASWFVERAVREEGSMTEMDLACWCDLTYLQIRGAALHLIRQGKARWLRRKLVLLNQPAQPPAKPVAVTRPAPMNKQQQARTLAKKYAIDIEWDGRGGSIWVYPADGQFSKDQDDPYYDDHACDDWPEALRRVRTYVNRMFPGGPAASAAPAGQELRHLLAPYAIAPSSGGRPSPRALAWA